MECGRRLTWAVLLLPVGVVALGRRRRMMPSLLAAVLTVGLMAAGGCGAARLVPATLGTTTTTGSTVSTPSGSYNLVVAGSSAGLVRSLNLTLVVQ